MQGQDLALVLTEQQLTLPGLLLPSVFKRILGLLDMRQQGLLRTLASRRARSARSARCLRRRRSVSTSPSSTSEWDMGGQLLELLQRDGHRRGFTQILAQETIHRLPAVYGQVRQGIAARLVLPQLEHQLDLLVRRQ